jgi:hypothetical protein
MGFDGFVVGDWNGHAQIPGCSKDRCALAINAGVDMVMAPQDWKALFRNMVAQVGSGEISSARLDDAVRRILRVKVKLGAFDPERPYDGRLELIGSAAHRALAREAVRESLVLLKNDGVLPIKSSARVLVTGAADDIGLQAGGWTISWQGTGNKKADFPGGESIVAGIKAALLAGGGTLYFESNGPYTDMAAARIDAAIVVFGEKPYAEMAGDIKLPLYNDRAALTELTRFHKLGIPVVPFRSAAMGQPGTQSEQRLRGGLVAGNRRRRDRRCADCGRCGQTARRFHRQAALPLALLGITAPLHDPRRLQEPIVSAWLRSFLHPTRHPRTLERKSRWPWVRGGSMNGAIRTIAGT